MLLSVLGTVLQPDQSVTVQTDTAVKQVIYTGTTHMDFVGAGVRRARVPQLAANLLHRGGHCQVPPAHGHAHRERAGGRHADGARLRVKISLLLNKATTLAKHSASE